MVITTVHEVYAIINVLLMSSVGRTFSAILKTKISLPVNNDISY
jgi:hypothetical protein